MKSLRDILVIAAGVSVAYFTIGVFSILSTILFAA